MGKIIKKKKNKDMPVDKTKNNEIKESEVKWVKKKKKVNLKWKLLTIMEMKNMNKSFGWTRLVKVRMNKLNGYYWGVYL